MDIATAAYYFSKMLEGKEGKCIFCGEDGVLTYTVTVKDKNGLPDIKLQVFQCMVHMAEEADELLEGKVNKKRTDKIGALLVELIKKQNINTSDDIKNKNSPEAKKHEK